MKKPQECINDLKSLFTELSSEPETLSLIQKFIFQLELDIEKACPSLVEKKKDDFKSNEAHKIEQKTDDSEIVIFLKQFKDFLNRNKSVDKTSLQKLSMQILRPRCRCPEKPCPPQDSIVSFMESIEKGLF